MSKVLNMDHDTFRWHVDHSIQAEDWKDFTWDLEEGEDYMIEERKVKDFQIPLIGIEVKLMKRRLVVFPSARPIQDHTRYSSSKRRLIVE